MAVDRQHHHDRARKAARNDLQTEQEPHGGSMSLNTSFFAGHEGMPSQPYCPPAGAFSHWLSVEQIRKQQRMRRESVIQAMESGELPYERRGRIRYARLSDVLAWEERRLQGTSIPSKRSIDPDLEDLAG